MHIKELDEAVSRREVYRDLQTVLATKLKQGGKSIEKIIEQTVRRYMWRKGILMWCFCFVQKSGLEYQVGAVRVTINLPVIKRGPSFIAIAMTPDFSTRNDYDAMARVIASNVLHEIVHHWQPAILRGGLNTAQVSNIHNLEIAKMEYLADPSEIEAHAVQVAMGLLDMANDDISAANAFVDNLDSDVFRNEFWYPIVSAYAKFKTYSYNTYSVYTNLRKCDKRIWEAFVDSVRKEISTLGHK
jgi:hypothetical protein